MSSSQSLTSSHFSLLKLTQSVWLCELVSVEFRCQTGEGSSKDCIAFQAQIAQISALSSEVGRKIEAFSADKAV